jgi:hypothetical protein
MQLLLRIVADRVESIPGNLKPGQHPLQLDELRHARRSPVGRAMKNDDHFLFTSINMEINEPPVLIWQR